MSSRGQGSHRMHPYIALVHHDDGSVVKHLIRGSAASSAVREFTRPGMPATAFKVQAGVLQANGIIDIFYTKELR